MSTERIRRRIEELLADAHLAYAGGDHEDAAALAAAVLSLDPDNAKAASLVVAPDQRRQMTLMFCDLVGSTALADGIDPEELSTILREYRTTCTAVIERYGGFVEDCLGDGVLVRFGYPWVHEDDARRAVLSGLEIVRAIADHPLELHLRIAVHTGLVVVGGREVVGAAANEAHRIQSIAEPDTVVISDTTHALVRDYFEFKPLGPAALRGVSRPLELFAVVGERASRALRASALQTPFTGRAAEQAVVAELWQAAAAGEAGAARALLVTAPAGMGKSRLVWECARTLDARLLAGGCSAYHRTTSLHPFGQLLRQICGVGADDDDAQRLAKLRARLADDAGTPGAVRHDLPVLADALAIPADTISPPTDVDAGKLRTIALHAAARLIHSTVDEGPVMLLVDDLHWADQSTLDLISVLLDEPCPGLLLVLAARPGFVAPWPDDALVRLALEPLPEAELSKMLRGMQQGSSFEDAQQRELIARCDGVPLFLEELVRSRSAVGGARGAASSLQAPGSRVPDALRDPLLARLVLPGVDLQLAQIAATIGRDVDRDLLQRASGLADRAFQAKLANLVAAGLVYPSAEDTIRFRHDLIREVAYETQLRSACRERHSLIADLLRDGAARRSGDAGELAFHLEQAQRIGEAIEAHLEAGAGHQALGAHEEAMSKFTHVLELVEQLPDGAPRLTAELRARQLRSFSTIITRGYSSAATAEDQGRCVELCELMGLTPELLPSLIVSWSYYLSHGDVVEAERVCMTMDRVSGSGPAFPATAMTRGIVCFFQGRLDEAHALMHAFLADPWAQTPGMPPAGWPLPNDPFVAASAHLLVTSWIRGDRAEAESLGAQGLRRVRELEFPFGPFSSAFLRAQLTIVRRLEGDHAASAQLGVELMELGDRHGFELWALTGQIQRLISQVHLGNAAALGPLEAAIGTWRNGLAIEVYASYWLTELALAQHAVGRFEQAQASLDEALGVAAITGSDFYSAETLRIRGVVRCQAGDRAGVDDIAAAVEKARAQGAGAFELRALAALERERDGRFAAP